MRASSRSSSAVSSSPSQSGRAEPRGLRPASWYFYRFRAGNQVSPVGRTRTAPDPRSSPERLRLAVVSCQDWRGGFYSTYWGVAEEDLDAVVHLGDCIYEYGPKPGAPPPARRPRGELPGEPPQPARPVPQRSRPAAAHAAHPFILTWDDHEVENNYAAAIPERGADPSHGGSAEFLGRRARAYQAYYEHLPLRLSQRPTGPNALLYRRLSFGDLAELSVLDTRQYRSDQPCGDGVKPRCAAALDPAATMMGPAQERWLLEGLDRSSARWNVIAQQTMFAEYDVAAGPTEAYNLDQWDGYVAARGRILGFLAQRRPSNPIVLSGDIHSSWVHDLKTDFADPASATVGTEFVGTSISSDSPAQAIDAVTKALPENRTPSSSTGRCAGTSAAMSTGNTGGAPTGWSTPCFVPGARTRTLATFAVEDSRPGAQQV